MDMERKRRGIVCALGVLFLVALVAGPAHGAAYPDRTITLVVPFVPGGVTDLAARLVAEGMQRYLKESVVVVNKPGGAMTIAGNAVATARPDGYTLGFFPSAASIPEVYTYFYDAPYSSKDLKAVSQFAVPVFALTVKADSPINSVKELIDYARKNPNTKIGTHGKTSLGYLAARKLSKVGGVTFVNVPFDGDMKIVPAILGGQIPVGTPAYPAIKALLDAKQLKVLALLTPKRAAFAPSTPTMAELGYKLAAGTYLGVFAPKGTPDEIVRRLDGVIAKVAAEPETLTRMNSMGTLLLYRDSASFQKAIWEYADNLKAFFKEEGLVK